MTSRKIDKVITDSYAEDSDSCAHQSLVTSEETINVSDNNNNVNKKKKTKRQLKKRQSSLPSESLLSRCSLPSSFDGKKIVGFVFFGTIAFLLWDALMRPPEERFLKPDAAAKFLKWVEINPYWGIGAFLVVIAICVILLLPIGTPLTMGCGFIYKGVYGWYVGVAVATIVSMAGSALGAVGCFLLGRYMMRDRVRKWVRKYPLFDAIDMAVSEHGLRIMAMLYLTPVLPLGPVSYMCGSTSMALSSFILAKIASLPLMLLYVYIGAAAGTLIADAEAIEHNSTLILSGIFLSAVMITCISHYIRKELMHILDRQKSGGKKVDEPNDLELGPVQSPVSYNEALQRRHVANDATETDAPLKGK